MIFSQLVIPTLSYIRCFDVYCNIFSDVLEMNYAVNFKQGCQEAAPIPIYDLRQTGENP